MSLQEKLLKAHFCPATKGLRSEGKLNKLKDKNYNPGHSWLENTTILAIKIGNYQRCK